MDDCPEIIYTFDYKIFLGLFLVKYWVENRKAVDLNKNFKHFIVIGFGFKQFTWTFRAPFAHIQVTRENNIISFF